MESLVPEIARHLNDTLSPNNAMIQSAKKALDELSTLTVFPFSLIAIISGEYDGGQRLAAATYLKNFIYRVSRGLIQFSFENFRGDFRNQLVQALLQAEPEILRVLVDAYYRVLDTDAVKDNAWPELVTDLKSAIFNSNLISNSSSSPWKTINVLTVLQATIKPYKYFLNPQFTKESTPQQLELITKDILVPLHAVFHQATQKVILNQSDLVEPSRMLLILCKCIYLAVRSYMPPALGPTLHLWCQDFFCLLGSLNFEIETSGGTTLLRMKIGKRCLLIFCALVTRHRKQADKLMPEMINSALNLVKQSPHVHKLDFVPERVISLAFDVISHVLETGPGWKIVSPHFGSLLDSAIFPALIMSNKDTVEWEVDPDEYLLKNLPSELCKSSGSKEELFTARKSAINLLGVMAKSKGPPLSNTHSGSSAISAKRKKGAKNVKTNGGFCFIGESHVMPFLSKFSIPLVSVDISRSIIEYYGVLMAYGGLQEFLKEKNSDYTAKLVQYGVLPLFSSSTCSPYLLAAASWLLGELASCLPQEMSADIYKVLLRTMVMNVNDVCWYPVRASSAAAVAKLLENDYEPPEWLPLLQHIVNGMSDDYENASFIKFQLLLTVVTVGDERIAAHVPMLVSAVSDAIAKHIPPSPESWPQVVEPGLAALASLTGTWVDSVLKEEDPNNMHEQASASTLVIGSLVSLLNKAWLSPVQAPSGQTCRILPARSCLDEVSSVLGSVLKLIRGKSELLSFQIEELLVIWSELIAEWDAWEEMEDMAVFAAIEEVLNIDQKFGLKVFLVRDIMSPPAPPVPPCSMIEGISAFLSKAVSAYPSATWRACSCAHKLLQLPSFSSDTEDVKKSLIFSFTQACFTHFMAINDKPVALWKPLLLLIGSCYISEPDYVEKILEKIASNGLIIWASAVAHISSNLFEPSLSSQAELKLSVMTLIAFLERNSPGQNTETVGKCFVSLLEATISLKNTMDINVESDVDMEDVDEDEDFDAEEDSDDDVDEETEAEYLEKYERQTSPNIDVVSIDEGDVEDQIQEIELGASFVHQILFFPYNYRDILGLRLQEARALVRGLRHFFYSRFWGAGVAVAAGVDGPVPASVSTTSSDFALNSVEMDPRTGGYNAA